MSRFQSTRRRLSLLAGSSLALALGSAGIALAPSAAHAANECAPIGVDPSANAGADSYTCTAGLYPTGVTYDSDGDLTVIANPPVDPNFGQPLMEVGVVGVNLTATSSDSLTWNSSTAVLSGSDGAILDASSESGDIDIDVMSIADYTFSSATVTHGVRAISSAGGDVMVDVSGYISGGLYGVEARSSGGDGNVTVNLNSGGVNGSTRAVYTNTTGGTGDTEININDISLNSSVEAVSGSGLLTINFNAGRSFPGVVTNAGGDAVINVSADYVLEPPTLTDPAIAATMAAGTTTTVNNLGLLGYDGGSGPELLTITAAGAGTIEINNSGWLGGPLDLDNTGGSGINIDDGGRWRSNAASTLGSGDDIVTVSARALISTGSGAQSGGGFDMTQIDFGAGTNTLANAGALLIATAQTGSNGNQPDPANRPSEVSLLNLTNFENAGSILLGGTMDGVGTFDGGQPNDTIYANAARGQTVGTFTGTDGVLAQATDWWADDILSMPGATFTGAEGSRVVFDVDLMRGPQASCDGALRNADDDLVADCLLIADGETAGTTLVTVHDIYAGDRGLYNPEGITLIDVNGGTSSAEHFTIDPLSDSYGLQFGGVIDKGAFFYPLVYDEDTQRHKLVGLVSGNAAQLPLLSSAAQSLWRVSTGSWLERQADLRGAVDDAAEGGVWLRINSEFADRDVGYSTGAYGTTFDFDNSYSQTSYAVTGGADLIVGGEGDTAYVVGLMVGYSHADIDFEASPNTGEIDGWTGGLYASLVSGGLFVDAVVNANKADLKNDIPALNLFPAGTILDTHLLSVGGQVEAGWKVPLTDSVFVEPLVSVSYVRTTYDDLDIPAGDPAGPRIGIEFDDPTSLRASVGGRIGLDQDYGAVRAQVSGLVRVWNEFEGETVVTLQNLAADPTVTDDFSGQFTEVGVGAGVYSASGIVSGFLNLGGKFGEDYQATAASAGVRVTW